MSSSPSPPTNAGDSPSTTPSISNHSSLNNGSKKRCRIVPLLEHRTASLLTGMADGVGPSPPPNPNKRLNTGRRRRPNPSSRTIPKFKLISLTFKGKKPRLSGPDRRRIKAGGNGNLTVEERAFLSLPAYKRNRYKLATAVDMVEALGLTPPKGAKKQDILEFLMDRLIEKENGHEFMTLVRPAERPSAAGSTEDDEEDDEDDDDEEDDEEDEEVEEEEEVEDDDGEAEDDDGEVEHKKKTGANADQDRGSSSRARRRRRSTKKSNNSRSRRRSGSGKPPGASPGTAHRAIAVERPPAITFIGPDSRPVICNLGPILDREAPSKTGGAVVVDPATVTDDDDDDDDNDGDDDDENEYIDETDTAAAWRLGRGVSRRRASAHSAATSNPKPSLGRRTSQTACRTSSMAPPPMSSNAESMAAAAVAAAAKAATATMPAPLGHIRRVNLKLPPTKDRADVVAATPPSTPTMEHWRLGLTPTTLLQFRLPTVAAPLTPLCGPTTPLSPAFSMFSITPNAGQTQDKFSFPPDLFKDDCEDTACCPKCGTLIPVPHPSSVAANAPGTMCVVCALGTQDHGVDVNNVPSSSFSGLSLRQSAC